MPNLDRKNTYKQVIINDNVELDYIDTELHKIELGQQTTITVSQFMEGRLDLISYFAYKNVSYGWLIMLANNIIDPFTEITKGTELIIPPLSDYYDFYNANAKKNR